MHMVKGCEDRSILSALMAFYSELNQKYIECGKISLTISETFI